MIAMDHSFGGFSVWRSVPNRAFTANLSSTGITVTANCVPPLPTMGSPLSGPLPPNYEHAMLGRNRPESGLPIVGYGGTQLTAARIPGADRLRVKARLGTLLQTEKPPKE